MCFATLQSLTDQLKTATNDSLMLFGTAIQYFQP